MADGVVLHTNSGVHIGLAPLVCSMVDGGQSASMLRAAALLRALPPLSASFPRPAVNSKQRTEMAEDATAVESSLASLQAEQPELFVAVTQAGIGESPDPRGLCLGTDSLVGDGGHPANGSTEPSCGQAEVDGGMVFGSGVEQVRVATYPVIPLRTAALPVMGEEAAPLASTDLPASPLPHVPPAAPRDGGSWYWCSTMGEWVESMDGSDVPPDPRGLCLGTDNLVGDGSRPSRGRYRDPLEDLMASTEDPGAYYQGLAYPSGDDSDGSSGEFSFDGIVEHMRAATISQSPAPHAASFALADDVAAPLPRGLRWLRSAWRAVVERSLRTGHHFAPRRFPSESDYDYLLRVGFYHDDPFGEAGFGWCDAVDAGWPEGHLGGQVFSLFHDAYYTSLWARCMWRRALRGAQRMLMSERGLAWLALRNAQTQMRVALRSLVAERRRSAFLWLGGRAEHTRRLDHLQGAWCAAARRVLECRAVLHTPVRARPRRRRVRGRGTG